MWISKQKTPTAHKADAKSDLLKNIITKQTARILFRKNIQESQLSKGLPLFNELYIPKVFKTKFSSFSEYINSLFDDMLPLSGALYSLESPWPSWLNSFILGNGSNIQK